MMTRASNEIALAISTTCCAPTRSRATGVRGSTSSSNFASSARASRVHPPIVDQAESIERLAAEEDVFGDAQVGNEIELLKDDRDAGLLGFARIAKVDRPAVQQNFARVGRKHAGQNVHQRRFAGAVLAQRAH